MFILAFILAAAVVTPQIEEDDFHPMFDFTGKVHIVEDVQPTIAHVKAICGQHNCGCYIRKDDGCHVVYSQYALQSTIDHEKLHCNRGAFHLRPAYAEQCEEENDGGFGLRTTKTAWPFPSER
jgi:hypothetical protein